MRNLCLLNVIAPRDSEEQLLSFFDAHDVRTITCIPCEGTAGKNLLSLLGLENTEKVFMYAMTTHPNAKKLMRAMISELGLEMPGRGVTFTIPVGSIAGASSLNHFTNGQDIILGEVNEMSQTFLYDLIIAISNRGHAATVMDAARSAGAMGGTIIHARGTNPQSDNTFFGLSIAEEKDMLVILCAANQKATLMRAIMEQAGVNSPAHTVMFALPVDSVAGLQSVIAAAGGEAIE